MSIKISHVIESKLRFLALTRAGKIRLCVFSDKVLYHAINTWQRTFITRPEDPFNTYFSFCILESQRLQIPPTWENMDKFPNFDDQGDVTLQNEKFDMAKCHKIMDDFAKQKPRHVTGTRREYSSNHKSNGPSFTQGITYWKHGKTYPYPDQAFDGDSIPCKEDPNWRPKKTMRSDDPRRLELNQVDELKKAVRSGKLNKEGLLFLREVYVNHKPELIPIIDAYLNDQASPDDSQHPLF